MIDDAVWHAIVQSLPSYLDRQRWYADKHRPIRSLELIDAATVANEPHTILLTLIGVEYETGDHRRYFVPMTFHTEPSPERFTIVAGERDGERFWLQDAPSDDAFRDFLVAAGTGLTLNSTHGRFEFEPWILDGEPFVLEPGTISAAAAVEQSNSSIVFGTQAIAKLYRRLEPGQNIEVDMNRFLSSEAGFRSIPKLIGSATYHGSAGAIPLALVQEHAGDHRDGWTALLYYLRNRDADSLAFVERLGAVTAEMHVALAAAPADSPLAPELVSQNDIDGWKTQLLRAAEETDWLIGERVQALPDRSKAAARNYLASTRNWNERAHGYDVLLGAYKTRVHGDYHLGQVLVTADRRLLVVDFEGEPQRPAWEREAKYSPLKDVAGMLRSLSYATGVAADAIETGSGSESLRWLEQWEDDARNRFLSAYRRVVSVSAVPIVPDDDEAFTNIVSALEMDKALYEVRYELSSRPDWAWLPLESLE
ncbi:MAG TPA: phosphotransferase [Thermomicrobiales bacterium]|nr:phosphotransferase [Thermomicrobiales bacterium]